MLYIVHTTGQCNLKCDYCGGSFDPRKVPWSVKYDYHLLKKLVERDEDSIVAFYGGEPLLNKDFVKWVLENVRAKHFVIQTNGTLVKSLPERYWHMFDAVLLSVDGRESVTDKHRGSGVYRRVVESARWLREIGFKGDLIARMTVTEDTDIYEDVKHLLSLGLFSHVHWQLDVVWSDRWKCFSCWRDGNYLPGVAKLVKEWLEEMRRGKVLGIAPFKALITRAFHKSYSAPPCGAGVSSFSILTDGRIVACPIAVEERWALVGRVEDGEIHPERAPKISEPCSSCRYFEFCGGRCLYAYMERLWGEDGFREVCVATQRFIDIVLSTLNEVKELLSAGVVSMSDIYYPPFNNTVEVIP
ncbi:TIGR04084 family radical SAM/SPASM domain-containing protein [Thermofilum pendens]|uniref:Radical SAM domain protein n=1 Tax=Thermofilum pendens (strain DSM 2475 / Hrk 5) TaxID=368408 RepID=A1RWA3_THEPD|nr:TIGR04084 family radical SAM/SPASM domain-containing protein [Thermofilum pendens]ABL77483.1 Radical SAM domain protein [Thermofilum pendens Hrk 5]